MVQATLLTDITTMIHTIIMCGTVRKAHHLLRYALLICVSPCSPLVDITISEELGETARSSNEPELEYRLPNSWKCSTHARPSWSIPHRAQHTTSPRTFFPSLYILCMACLTLSTLH